MLRLEVAKQLGEFSIDASFASEGRVTGLFGASGAGKTSLINMIAGLLRPDRGIIAVDGEVLDDTAARMHVPVHRRRIGYVFQDARLFPHLDIRRNLDYGRRMNRLADDPAQRARITDLLDIGGLLARRPASSPAASASAWPWDARCWQSRDCCCWMSRWARSMEINVSFGRHVGDRLLQCVAERLKRRFGGADDLGYFGSGTFAAVFSIQDGRQAAADARASETQLIPHVGGPGPDEGPTTAVFGQPFAIGDFAVPVTVKCGLARFPEDGADPETLLQFADRSLQKLRDRGPGLPRRLVRSARLGASPHPALERHLERALENEHFELHYQPQVDQRSSKIVAVEALLRWNCPERGLVSPGLFLPTLEASRLMVPMSEWVLARAASDWRRWQELGLAPIRLAVNLSRAELARKDFATRFLDASWLHGPSRCWLDVEIPEDTLIADPDNVLQTLKVLRAEGTRVAVDDFAMGAASPHRLGELPIDSLKIDRSFVSRLARDPRTHAVVSSIVSLARAYGLQTIAEGVETRQQMQILYSLGCEQSQGFLHSPPIATPELEDLLGSIAA